MESSLTLPAPKPVDLIADGHNPGDSEQAQVDISLDKSQPEFRWSKDLFRARLKAQKILSQTNANS